MTDALPRFRKFARPVLALFAGFLAAMSLPPWGFWPLAFVGVAVFELVLGVDISRRERAWCGFSFGLAWMLMGMGWMWHLTIPGYLLASALFAALHAAAAAIAPSGPWRTIGRPAAHTLAEVIRISIPFGGIPLATLGISQAGGPLLGLARLGGVILITWVVFQLGFAAVRIAIDTRAASERRFDGTRARRREFAALAAIVVLFSLAAVAPEGTDGPMLTVAAVQGGGEQGTSALDVPSSEVTQALLDATATIEQSDELDLVVWPENGIDINREPFDGSVIHQTIAVEAARLGVPISVGITEDSEFSNHPVDDHFVNAQVVVGTDGEIVSRYEKVRRVPFGEYVPFRGVLEALGAPLDRVAADAIAGQDPPRISLPDGTQLGVMISWEVFFGDLGNSASDGAILLNPTNGASYTGTILQTQQVASSKLRATETGRWVVQVSPTGFSAFVDPDGGVHQRTGVSERRVITMDVPLRTGTTWYTALTDLPWTLAVIMLLGLALWNGGLRERWRPSDRD
jgi:apolipoprotein N-acyltransferase